MQTHPPFGTIHTLWTSYKYWPSIHRRKSLSFFFLLMGMTPRNLELVFYQSQSPGGFRPFFIVYRTFSIYLEKVSKYTFYLIYPQLNI